MSSGSRCMGCGTASGEGIFGNAPISSALAIAVTYKNNNKSQIHTMGALILARLRNGWTVVLIVSSFSISSVSGAVSGSRSIHIPSVVIVCHHIQSLYTG